MCPRSPDTSKLDCIGLRGKIESEELELKYKPGTENCSDMFTKCLGTKDFLRHRMTLGFVEHELPLSDLRAIQEVLLTAFATSAGQEMAFVEVCCAPQSALRIACRVARMP